MVISGTMILAFAALFWWILRDAWDRNEKEHSEFKTDLKAVGADVDTVSNKVDHMIRYHGDIPPYPNKMI